MNSLVETGTQDAFRRDDVDRLEVRDAGQQIEIRHEQPVGVRNPVGHRHDHVTNRFEGGLDQQTFTKNVFVAGAGSTDAPVVLAESFREKSRLLSQTACAPIHVVGTKRLVDERFEPVNRLRLPPEVVVEPQHLRDQSGPEAKRRLGRLGRRSGGREGHDGSFERGETLWRGGEPGVKLVVELVASDGRHRCPGRFKLSRRALCRNDDERSLPLRGDGRNRLAKSTEIRHAHESRPARGDG